MEMDERKMAVGEVGEHMRTAPFPWTASIFASAPGRGKEAFFFSWNIP